MSWIKLIWLIISNLPAIIKLIKELIDIFSGLKGTKNLDETIQIKAAKLTLKKLADKTNVPCPSDLV